MSQPFEVSVENLFKQCDPAQFDFSDTSALEPLETVIGLVCEIHPLDWRFVDGRLFFAHVQSDK